MTSYETKDSGERQQWASGMQRDVQTDKPRFALMWTKRQPYDEQMVTRYAGLLARGAKKYEDRNWEEGCGQEELDYAMESLGRHTAQLICGETDEDHAAAVWFNTQLIEYIRWRMRQNEPKTDEEVLARDRAERSSEINNLALQKAAQIRRRERLLASAKEFDAELTQDAMELARQADAELDRKLVHGDVPVTPEEDEAWKELRPSTHGQKRRVIDVNDDGTPFYGFDGFDGSKSGAVGLFQLVPDNWSEFIPQEKSLGQQIADNLRRYREPQRFTMAKPKPDPDPVDFPDSYPDAN